MKNIFQEFKSKFLSFIIDSPKQSILIAVVLFLSSIVSLYKIESNFTPRIWFHKNSQQIKDLESYEKRFGSDQNIIIGIYSPKGILTKENINLFKDLTKKMWLLPDVVRVESITNYNYIETINDDINISPLVGDDFNIDDVTNKIRSLDEVKDVLVSKNYEFSLVYAKLKPFLGENPNYSQVMSELENTLKSYYNNPNIRPIVLGSVSVTYAFRDISKVDTIKTIPLMMFMIIILLAFYFRSFAGVFIPLFICSLTIGLTFGFLGHLSLVFNSILAAIPGILMAICLADSIHILTSFYQSIDKGHSIKEALIFAMDKNFLATILTTITTALSFFTISITELIPIRDLGILAGLGTITAWFFSYLLIAPTITLLPKRLVLPKSKFTKKIKLNSTSFTNFILNNKLIIILIFSTFTFFAFWKSIDNEVNSDPLKYFSKNTTIKKDYDFTKKYLDGIRGAILVIDSNKVDGVKDPDFLNRVDSYLNEISSWNEIVKVNSLLDIIKKMNQNLNNGKSSFYTIPQTQGEIAEALFLYTLGLPPGLGIESQVTSDYRYLHVPIKWTIETTKDAVKANNKIHNAAKKYNLKTSSGGSLPIYIQVNEKVVDSFFKSMLMAVFFVSIIILITFREPLLSALAMLPNIIPLFFGAAYMAINHIYIDIGTSIVSAICLGIAVDDTIHFITHFVMNRQTLNNDRDALMYTFKTTGKALVMTTLTLVCGFGSFLVADFLPNHYFGVLCAIVLSFALITDLLLLPAILLIWSKKKRMQEATFKPLAPEI